MQVTDVKIRKLFEDKPLKAVLSLTFDDCFALHDVKIVNVDEHFFVVMPSKKNRDGTFRDVAHPLNSEFRNKLEKIILNAYKNALESEFPLSKM